MRCVGVVARCCLELVLASRSSTKPNRLYMSRPVTPSSTCFFFLCSFGDRLELQYVAGRHSVHLDGQLDVSVAEELL